MKNLSKVLRLPKLGRLGVTFDNGDANHMAGMAFGTKLTAQVIRNGKAVPVRDLIGHKWRGLHRYGRRDTVLDLGSGLVTNVGVSSLAADFLRSANLNLATLNLANQHVTGTGNTTATATDIKLQTPSTNGGQTAVTGTQKFTTATNLQKYHTEATVAYTGTEAVVEWGLMCGPTLSSATGSPLTAVSSAPNTTVTVTGSGLTASSPTVRGLQGYILEDTTTGCWGLITSNTTSQITVAAWYKTSDGTASTGPLVTDAFVVRPVMWDRKVFAPFNPTGGDSILFTYDMTITSGG